MRQPITATFRPPLKPTPAAASVAALALVAGLLIGCDSGSAGVPDGGIDPEAQRVEAGQASPGDPFPAPGPPSGAVVTPPPQGSGQPPTVTATERQWRDHLSPQAYRILREHGTERAFSGPHVNNKAEGTYHCAGCGLPLFDAATKFKSGTGWPSFTRVIDNDHIKRVEDLRFGMVRTEVRCGSCDGHLGHVFPDGPRPGPGADQANGPEAGGTHRDRPLGPRDSHPYGTGRRYCINGHALAFVPSSVGPGPAGVE